MTSSFPAARPPKPPVTRNPSAAGLESPAKRPKIGALA
jgi:hypothetical protein